jgi:protein gp37
MSLTRQGPGKIEWTDWSLNPFPGCSYGCEYCYARDMARRFRRPFEPEYRPEDFQELKRIKTPSRIFLPSAGEMLGQWVKSWQIREAINRMAEHPQHTFQILSKNPIRYWEFEWPSNCWLGTSVDGTEFTKKNVSKLMDNCDDKNIRFVSLEPMQSMPFLGGFLSSVDWIIIGGRTGKRPFRPPSIWTDAVVNFARKNNIAVFVKDNARYKERIQEYPCQK